MKIVPNANTKGRGGEVAALARQFSDGALVRIAAVVAGERVVEPGDIVRAARTVLRGGDYVPNEVKLNALNELNRLVNDPKTPDSVAVRASKLVLEATGRKAFRPRGDAE